MLTKSSRATKVQNERVYPTFNMVLKELLMFFVGLVYLKLKYSDRELFNETFLLYSRHSHKYVEVSRIVPWIPVVLY